MIRKDENGELHPEVPRPLGDCKFLVTVQNNETGELYTDHFALFTHESSALDYAKSFNQHWIVTKVLLIPVDPKDDDINFEIHQ